MSNIARALRQVWRVCRLPLVLVAIFIVQNFLFNYWLKIEPGEYAARRLAATAALGVLLFAPALLVGKRLKYPYLISVSLIPATILSVEYLYYSYSGGFLQASALLYAGEGAAIMPTVKTLVDWHLIVFAAGLLVAVGAWVVGVVSAARRPLPTLPLAGEGTDPTCGDNLTLPSPRLRRGSGTGTPPLLFQGEDMPAPRSRSGVGVRLASDTGEGLRRLVHLLAPDKGRGYRRGVGETLTIKQKLVALAAIIIFSASGYGYLFSVEKNDQENIANVFKHNQLYNVGGIVGKTGIVNFFLSDTLALALHADKVNAADENFVQNFKAQQQPIVPDSDIGSLKGRNVIMIQVESLENAVIDQKYNEQEITPNLNKLAASGMYFSNYYSPVGPGTTADAEFMTLNSLFSLPNTVAFVQYAYDNYTALPALLKQNGYSTYSLHGDVPSFWNRANIYPQLGYEKWFSRADYTIPRNIGVYDLGDKDFFEQSLPKLAAMPKPFMATLITLTSHTPFELPDDLNTFAIPDNSTLTWQQKGYLKTVHYTDQAIGDFIEQLKAAGLYDNSVIFIYGDHGSFTGIADALGVKNSVFPDLQTSQVPLIVLAPKSKIKGKMTIPASHLDLYPTVADLLGIKPPQEVFGHDMIDGNNAVAVSRNLVSGTVNSVMTAKLAFHAGADGEFDDGECLAMPEKKTLDVSACKSIYDAESNAVKASDIMIKGNLIDTK